MNSPTNSIEWPVNIPVRTGSIPVWHPEEKRLYWSDGEDGHLYRFDPASGLNELCLHDRPIGAMTLQSDGSLLLFRGQANVVVFRDDAVVETVINSIADFKLSQFVSAAADSKGRVLCGVLSDSRHTGRLLRLDTNGRLDVVDEGFGIPAGMAFDASCSHFYFNDAHGTHAMTWCYDYDAETGTLSERRPFYSALEEPNFTNSVPMGLAIDFDGGIYVTRWGGAEIIHHDADGTIIERISLSAKKPVGVVFGGEQLEDIYITTSGGHRRAIEGLRAGGIAKIRIKGVTGIAPFKSAIKGA